MSSSTPDVGQHGSADETIRRQPAKLFDKVIVERPHDGQERVPVPDGGVARFGGVEHLGVDAVGVLLLQPLFRRSRAAGVVEIEAHGAELLGRLARELVRAADLERPAFLDDGVHAVGQLDAPGRPGRDTSPAPDASTCPGATRSGCPLKRNDTSGPWGDPPRQSPGCNTLRPVSADSTIRTRAGLKPAPTSDVGFPRRRLPGLLSPSTSSGQACRRARDERRQRGAPL